MVTIFAGPTASGKSGYALEWAEKYGGEIINADSLQLYADLRILTARPSDADLTVVHHHLYGVLSGNQRSHAAEWASRTHNLIEEISKRGHAPILVGGTGFYIKALIEGLAPIPPIPQNLREEISQEYHALSLEERWRWACSQDPLIPENLQKTDRQRIIRALEVFQFTGKSLFLWQKESVSTDFSDYIYYVLTPDRCDLHRNIEYRVDEMLRMGAIEEVEALSPESPLHQAIGVREIRALLQGRFSKDEARERMIFRTRQYAKRQMTWFRHQSPPQALMLDPSKGMIHPPPRTRLPS